MLPGNIWVIPGVEWIFGHDWVDEDAYELGGLEMLLGGIAKVHLPAGHPRLPKTRNPMWDGNPLERGREVERKLGYNGGNWETIDAIDGQVSVKSLDFTRPSYQSRSRLEVACADISTSWQNTTKGCSTVERWY